jgi:hypothetical protein
MADKKDDPELTALMERYGLGASKTSESKPTIKSDVPVQVTAPPQEEAVPEEAPIQGESLIQAQERAEAEALNKSPENVIERNRLIAEVGAGLGGVAQYKGVGQKLMRPAMDLFAPRDGAPTGGQQGKQMSLAPAQPVTDIEHILQSGKEDRPQVTGRQKESGHNWESNRQALTQTGIEKTRPLANPMQHPIVQAGPMVPTASGIAIPKNVAVQMEQELQARQIQEAMAREQALQKQAVEQQRQQKQKATVAKAIGAGKGAARIGQGIGGGAIAAPQLYEYGRDVVTGKPADKTQALSGVGGLAMALGKSRAGFLGGLAQIPYAIKNRDELARSQMLADIVPDTMRMGMTGAEMYEPANTMPVKPFPINDGRR